jgi:hypothetical protein
MTHSPPVVNCNNTTLWHCYILFTSAAERIINHTKLPHLHRRSITLERISIDVPNDTRDRVSVRLTVYNNVVAVGYVHIPRTIARVDKLRNDCAQRHAIATIAQYHLRSNIQHINSTWLRGGVYYMTINLAYVAVAGLNVHCYEHITPPVIQYKSRMKSKFLPLTSR